MRFTDILGLSLGALYRQKLRETEERIKALRSPTSEKRR